MTARPVLHISFSFPTEFRVKSVNLNRTLQSFFYSLINDDNLHSTGFIYNNKRYKPFTFGILTPLAYDRETGEMVSKAGNEVSLVFSTPIDFIMNAVYSNILNKPITLNNLQPFHADVHVEKVEFTSPVTVMTVSPIVVAFYKNGRTTYLNPLNAGFTKALRDNAVNKYTACVGSQPKDPLIKFTLRSAHEKIIKVNFGYDYVIKAYDCIYTVEAKDDDFLSFSLSAGLGVKTALGFGCVEVA